MANKLGDATRRLATFMRLGSASAGPCPRLSVSSRPLSVQRNTFSILGLRRPSTQQLVWDRRIRTCDAARVFPCVERHLREMVIADCRSTGRTEWKAYKSDNSATGISHVKETERGSHKPINARIQNKKMG